MRGAVVQSEESKITTLSHAGARERKFAFTLAEVLITLGIIGVVAAMTIPTLMTKIQHKQTSARLKKFYSTMKQMNISAEEEFGDVGTWDKTLPAEEYLNKYFKPFLKGNVRQDSVNYKAYFEMADGSRFLVNNGNANICADIQYDVNGFSKPNRSGYDQFYFLYCPSGTNFCDGNGGFCSYRRKDWTTREFRLSKCQEASHTCAALLEYDNWEFKPDYPWK